VIALLKTPLHSLRAILAGAAAAAVERWITFRPGPSVTAVTLDGWLAERPDLASRVRCIKIDVGGRESRVLAGMTEALRPLGLTVICGTTLRSDADDMLGRAGFQRHRIERGTQPFGHFLYVRPSRLTAVNGSRR